MASANTNLASSSPRNGEASPSSSPRSRSGSISLQAAATLNAGLQRAEPVRRTSSNSLQRNAPSPSAGRRRSQVLTNLQIADPAVPGPGEMISDTLQAGQSWRTASPRPLSNSPHLRSSGDPHHARTPSLGELHQELENEQEFQVNRLLQEIRRLQVQLQRQQQGQQSAIVDDVPERLQTLPTTATPQVGQFGVASSPGSLPRSPGISGHPRSSFDMARADIQRRSRTPSRGASPRLRSTSIGAEGAEPWTLGGRDENAFYQAETQMLIRENQMLRHRIRELERQLSEVSGNTAGSSLTHEPSHSSNLNRSTSASEGGSSQQTPAPAASLPTAADAPKQE
ncbi:hypothetical protein VTK73DRAFT_1045 [Phialemonium thermophilum]|uniref:Uncharacterized protein n=1 Tax=Phialemonium thermophilum TaxID=223376 RepID=A0ABR3XBY7_9PEZI